MKSAWFVVLISASAYAHEDGVAAPSPDERHPDESATAKAKVEAPPQQTTVSAKRPQKAASQQTVKKEEYENRPRRSAASLLEVTPGLVTVQTAGGGKANQYFLRGFDIDHGTDLALTVDGVPVNMPTHAHGQGYADLNFLIPEIVDRVEVSKGSYSAKDGDFATAGAINLVTTDHVHQNRITLTAGNFGSYRGLLVAAPPPGELVDGYLAAEAVTYNGPTERGDHLRRYNVMSRAAIRPMKGVEVSLQLQSMMGQWDASGAIPLRLIESGELSRFGTLSPTDGGGTHRHALIANVRANDVAGGRLNVTAYGIRYGLDLYSNFSFYAGDEENGDQIRQTDLRTVTGLKAEYQRGFELGPVSLQATGGVQARNDSIGVALQHTAKRRVLSDITKDQVQQLTYAAYSELDVGFGSWAHTVLSARGDGFNYDVRGKGTLNAAMFSPKASLILTPLEMVAVFGNVGRGFHSNDARALSAPAAATSYEVGARFRPSRLLDVGLTAWGLDLDSELVWVGDEGRTESSGASRRRGLELDAKSRVGQYVIADVSGTLTEARFVEGGYVPLAPVWTLSAGLEARHPIGVFGAVRWTQVGARPANEDGSIQAREIALLDASVGYRYKMFTAQVEGLNLLNSSWYEGQFVSAARGPRETQAVDGLHVTPGYPLQVRASLTVTLD
jgi:outer membrane receptor protein involved in Fe transport